MTFHSEDKAAFTAGRTLQLNRLRALFDGYAKGDADAEALCEAGQLDPLDMEVAVSRRETWEAARHCVEMELGIIAGELAPFRVERDNSRKQFVRVWSHLTRRDAVAQREARAAWLARRDRVESPVTIHGSEHPNQHGSAVACNTAKEILGTVAVGLAGLALVVLLLLM